MRALWAIIAYTLRENAGRWAVYLLLALGAVYLIFSALFYSPTSSANCPHLDCVQVVGIARSISLQLVAFWGVVLGIFLGMSSYTGKRTESLGNKALSKATSRIQFLLGRYLGTLGFTLLATSALTVLAILIIAFRLGYLDLLLWYGIVITALGFALAVALAGFLSLLIPRIAAGLLTIIAYILSFVLGIESVKEMITVLPQNIVVKAISQIIYALTPPFADIQNLADGLMSGKTPPSAEWYSFFVGIFYLLLLLGFSLVIFSKRKIK